MKTQGLQELIKKIFSDEKTKAEFISNPESVLKQFSLSEIEKQALLKTTSRLSLITPDSQQLEGIVGPDTWWYSPVP
jgi:hypothetical protein